MMIGFLIIIGIIFIKYKPLYQVIIDGEVIGYIKNKNEFENRIDEYINTNEECVAFKTVNVEQSYNLEFVENSIQENEEQVLDYIKENTEVIYTIYAIVIDDDITTSVKTEEEAQKIIDDLNKKYENLDIDVKLRQIYTTNKPEDTEDTVQIVKVANTKISQIVTNRSGTRTSSAQILEAGTEVNGVPLYFKPVLGIITSKYGSRSSVRSSSHTGLDIATQKGTAIKAVTGGIVTFATSSGSYGNLVKISHGNGVETWYAHCDKLYVKEGEEVSAGDIIAAVGSTGNSTGPHLHLEIRINGNTVDPQKYIY